MGEQRAIRYSQSDISKAAKALRQAGVKDWTIRIDPRGNIEIIVADQKTKPQKGSSWDDVLDQ